jgi:hypothetical protein
MKKVRIIFILAALLFAFAACEKEAGPEGPAGPSGSNGNANVIQFNFSGFTLTDLIPDHNQKFRLSQAQSAQSVLLAYTYKTGATPVWYPIPGYTASGDFEYRAFYRNDPTNTDSTEFCMRRLSGTGDDIIDSLRILAIPASVINGKSVEELPNWKNYEEVKNYFNF